VARKQGIIKTINNSIIKRICNCGKEGGGKRFQKQTNKQTNKQQTASSDFHTT
jgi:hypothetical protein